MDFFVCKGFGVRWPHPARSSPSGTVDVLCGAHGEQGSIHGCPQAAVASREVFMAAPAVCLEGGVGSPCLLPSLLPYLLNLLSWGIGAVAICEPANNGINSFPWPG